MTTTQTQPTTNPTTTTPPEPPRPSRPPLDPRRAVRRAELKEHLANPYIHVEDVASLTFEANKIYKAFQPRNDWQDWVISMIATILVRLSRCDRIERRLRDMASLRAIDLWEEDQRLAVETLAVKLPKQPGRVVAQLRQTPIGIDWLIARWEGLARDESTGWTEAQNALARQLLGDNDAILPTEPGFARSRIEELRDLYDRIAEADAEIRSLVEADLSDAHVPGLAKHRRDKKAMFLQMKWYIDQFHIEHTDRWDDPMRQPGHISYDLLAQQNSRARCYNFTDVPPPQPAPDAELDSDADADEANPTSEPAIDQPNPPCEPAVAESNPIPTSFTTASDETNPLETPGSATIDETNPFSPASGSRFSQDESPPGGS